MACNCHTREGKIALKEVLPDDPCTTCALKHINVAFVAWGEFTYEISNRLWCAGHVRLAVEHLKKEHRALALELRALAMDIEASNDNSIHEVRDRLLAARDKVMGLYAKDHPGMSGKLDAMMEPKYVKVTTRKHLGDAAVAVGALQAFRTRYPNYKFLFESSFTRELTKGLEGFTGAIPGGHDAQEVLVHYGGVTLEREAKRGVFLQGFVDELCTKLGLPRFSIPVDRCNLELRPRYLPYQYVLISPDVQKASGECKRYPHWQGVVDNLAAKGWTVVQTGAKGAGNVTMDLENTVDLRGKTSVEDFIALCQHASWIVSSPSAAVHIGSSNNVPTTVISGGREMATLTKYPNTRHITSTCPKYPSFNGARMGCMYFNMAHETPQRNCKAPKDIKGEPYPSCLCAISPDKVTKDIPVCAQVPVLMPLGTGSCDDNNELRICLRSMERHCRNMGRLYIATTSPPDWLDQTKCTVVPIPDKRQNKDANIIDKMVGIIRKHGIKGRWVFNTDDQIFLKDCDLNAIPVVGNGRTRENLGEGGWYDRVRATFDLCEQRGTPLTCHMDAHTPQPFDASVAELLEGVDYNTGNGYTICTLFYGLSDRRPDVMQKDIKHTIQNAEDAAKCDFTKTYLGFNDEGYRALKDKLFERFPEKSIYEKY